MEKTELMSFNYVFQITKVIIFEVRYSRTGDNKFKYFATEAAEFTRSKQDFKQCGQCQEDVLKEYCIPYDFFKTFDHLHLKDLTTEQYNEITSNLERIKNNYNFLYSDEDHDIDFKEIKQLSMLKLKNKGYQNV